MEHKKPSSAAVSFSNLCEENNNAKSAGERLYGLTSIADNRTQGSDAGCFSAPMGPRSAGAAAALRLSSSGCLHLSPSLRRLPPPQAIWQKCAATLSSLFFYLEDDNSSYCCYYKEWHFVLFSLGENVLKLTELCFEKKKTENLRWLQQNVWDKKESVVGLLIPMCTGCASAVCKQPVDEQKTESYQLSEKGFVFFLFWTRIKAESIEVFSFLCCSFCPAIHSSWKTKPLHDPPWSRTLPESGRGLAKNWKPVFSSFFAFCWFWSWSAFTDSEISSPWQHCGARTEADELLFGYSRGT